jgi:hypothetical protein
MFENYLNVLYRLYTHVINFYIYKKFSLISHSSNLKLRTKLTIKFNFFYNNSRLLNILLNYRQIFNKLSWNYINYSLKKIIVRFFGLGFFYLYYTSFIM